MTSSSSPRESERIVVAVVTRPHGLRGAVRVKVWNPDTEVLAPGRKLQATPKEGDPRALTVAKVTPAPETWIVEFRGVTTVDAAEALRGAELSVARGELPATEEGEFYHADLVGCDVRDGEGRSLGAVKDVLRYPSVDALVVTGSDGKSETEIPIVDGIVLAIDVAARVITVDPTALEG